MNIPPGYVNFAFLFSRDGDPEPMVTSIGASWDGSTPYNDIVNDVFNTWASTTMDNQTTTSTTLQMVRAAFGTIDEGDLVIESSEDPVQGLSTSDVAPPNVALLIKKLTGSGGRANRGRMFYPDVRADNINPNGTLLSSGIGDYQIAIDAWTTAITNVTGVEGLFLFHSDPVPNPTAITSFVVQQKVATQRRRLRP